MANLTLNKPVSTGQTLEDILAGLSVPQGEWTQRVRNFISDIHRQRGYVISDSRLASLESPKSMPLEFNEIRDLQQGWDGYKTEPPSEAAIRAAEAFWLQLESAPSAVPTPRIEPGVDNFIEFMWILNEDMLQIWIYGESAFHAEWTAVKDEKESAGETSEILSLLKLVENFFGNGK